MSLSSSSSSLIHSNFNANRSKINTKYKDNIDQLLGFDHSNIIEVITGFLDDSLWGVTKYNNIVCLRKGLHFRKIIHCIDNPLCEQNNSSLSPLLTFEGNTNIKNNNDRTYDIHNKYKKKRKETKQEYTMNKKKKKNNKRGNTCNLSNIKKNKRKYKNQYKKYNYHSYFHNKPSFGDEVIYHDKYNSNDFSHDPYFCYFCNQYNLCEDEMNAETSYEENYDIFSLYWTE